MQTLLLTNATRPLSVRSMSAQRLNKVLSVCVFFFFFKQRSQYQPIKDVYAVAEREACAGWMSSGLVLLIKLYLFPAAVFVQASCLDGRDQVSRELGLSDLDLNRKSPLLLELVRRGRHRDKAASLAEVRQTS